MMNTMRLQFTSQLINEAFARTSLIAFLMPCNPTVDEIMELKTIVTEAIVNAMIHAYDANDNQWISMDVSYDEHSLVIVKISDEGKGIENIEKAMQPFYTTKASLERSGMGLTIMQTFSDRFDIVSEVNKGTIVTIEKQLHGKG